MRAIGHGQAGHAGVLRHQHVVAGIANDQCALRRDAGLLQYLQDHGRMGLGQALIGAARGGETVRQPGMLQRTLQPSPALARSHGQQMPATSQLRQDPATPAKRGMA